MLIKIEQPRFLTSLSKAIGKSAGDWRWHSMVPVRSLVCLLIGIGAAYNMPVAFWSKDHQVSAVLIYIGIFIFDGVLISVCWRMLIRIYEAISTPGFFSYLVNEDLIHGYLVYAQLVHSIQWVALFTSAFGVLALFAGPSYAKYDPIVFAAMIFTVTYALYAVFHMTLIIQDLLWQKAIVDDIAGKQTGREVPSKRRGALREINI